MTTTVTRISAVLVVAAAFTASANAEYRCAPAPTGIDRRACEAAEQGPDTLRRFVHGLDRRVEPDVLGLRRREHGEDVGSHGPTGAASKHRSRREGGQQRVALAAL